MHQMTFWMHMPSFPCVYSSLCLQVICKTGSKFHVDAEDLDPYKMVVSSTIF